MNQGAWGLGLENGCGILQSGAGGGAIERGEGRERGAGLEMGEGLGADLRRGWCTDLKKAGAQEVPWGREREGEAVMTGVGRDTGGDDRAAGEI